MSRSSRVIHYLKKGDTARKFSDTLTLAGSVIDLTDCTIRFLMVSLDGAVEVDEAADIVSATAGTVEYQPAVEDVAVAGLYKVEWKVTFPNASILTIPAGQPPGLDYVYLEILPDLEAEA